MLSRCGKLCLARLSSSAPEFQRPFEKQELQKDCSVPCRSDFPQGVRGLNTISAMVLDFQGVDLIPGFGVHGVWGGLWLSRTGARFRAAEFQG